jgi:hypothetical protein
MRTPRTSLVVALLVAGLGLLTVVPTSADDHLFTAVAAGGLTVSVSQPFINGMNNPGISGFSVPGQGSPLSGSDHTVPAVGTDTPVFATHATNANPGNGVLRTPPPVMRGQTAPIGHSQH